LYLHNPDGVAGGKAGAVTRMGDKDINSSIGSQWQHLKGLKMNVSLLN
jgi:hypothetical protein